MTVCIAAICSWPDGGPLTIVGASDRMISAEDIKFEPPQKKIYHFNEKAVALTAGDPYAHVAIGDEVSRALDLKPRKTIKELADLYADAFSAYRRQVAEAKYLKPLGLDANSFMDRSQDFRSDLVSDLRLDMQRETLEVEAIIAGTDETGPHLFVISDPGIATCADAIGFAAIGSGKSHADSHFMMARHTRRTLLHTALLNTYVAKRRSEVSPTVGVTTDLFFWNTDGFRDIADQIHSKLEQTYLDFEKKIAAATHDADSEIDAFIEAITSAPQPPESAIPTARRPVKKSRSKHTKSDKP